MSRTFTKLFSSITESTIWFAPDATRLVWITMLAMADRHGRVWGSVPGLAHRARVSIDDCQRAISELMSPDAHSRTKAHDGRRITVLGDGDGWVLLNHAKYRNLRDEESVLESKRRYINRRRAAERAAEHDVDRCRSESNVVDRGRANAEAEADAEAEAGTPTTCTAGAVRVEVSKASPADEVFAHYQTYHPRARVLGASERKKIEARLKEGFTVADLCSAIDGQHRSPHHLGQNQDGRQYLSLELAVRDSAKVNQFLAVPESTGASSVVDAVKDMFRQKEAIG